MEDSCTLTLLRRQCPQRFYRLHGCVQMFRKALCLAGAISLLLPGSGLLVGCHSRGATVTGSKTIAIITPAGGNEFNSELAAGAADEAKLLGWNPIKHLSPTGDSDDAALVDLAMKALSEKPDAISVCGMESSALEQVVNRANRDGIPIYVHNQISTVSGDVAAYFGYDEFEAGRKCGDYAVELLSKDQPKRLPVGEVAILDGSPGEHSKQRSGGFREALKFCAGVQIVEEKSGDWTKDNADKLVTDWLKRYPKLTLIFACNDNMAMGAAHAVYTASLNGIHRPVQIMGFGGSHDALVKVKYGELISTLALEPRKMGARIIHQMMDTFAGSDDVHLGDVVRTNTTLVNAQNLDDFMGGFDTQPPPSDGNRSDSSGSGSSGGSDGR